MTAVRTRAILGTIVAAMFAAGLTGAAMAAEKQQNQTDTTTPPANVAAPTAQPSANTAANLHALTVYLQWQKCKDNMLPKCP